MTPDKPHEIPADPVERAKWILEEQTRLNPGCPHSDICNDSLSPTHMSCRNCGGIVPADRVREHRERYR